MDNDELEKALPSDSQLLLSHCVSPPLRCVNVLHKTEGDFEIRNYVIMQFLIYKFVLKN